MKGLALKSTSPFRIRVTVDAIQTYWPPGTIPQRTTVTALDSTLNSDALARCTGKAPGTFESHFLFGQASSSAQVLVLHKLHHNVRGVYNGHNCCGRMGCQSEKRQRRPPEKQQQEVTGSSKNLPFLGKSFYLDLLNNKNMEFLVATIKQLGGVIESFLSKEVSYVVSSSKEAKLDSGPRRPTEKRSSAASGVAKAKTLPSAVPKGSHAGHHHKPADSALISRGKELLQKAMRNQLLDFPPHTEMMAYVQQLLFRVSGARKQSDKTMNPPSPSIDKRVVDALPVLGKKGQKTANWMGRAPGGQVASPSSDLAVPMACARACVPQTPLGRGIKAPEGCLTHSERERSPRSSPATVPKRRKGFCECCQETFGELQMHLQSPRHRRFALDASQYAAVDHVIAQLTNDFAEIPAWSSPPRVPCSPAADNELCGSRAKAVEGLGAPAAELGGKHQLARKDKAELSLNAVAVLGGECSTGPEEMPKEKVSELPPAPELPAGHPLLGLWAEETLRARPSASTGPAGRAHAWCQNTDQSAVDNSAVGATALATAPDLSQWTRASDGLTGEAAACSPELVPQDSVESLSHPLGASPCSRKRKLSDSPCMRLEKKPRIIQLSSDPLHLEKQTGSVCCSSVHRGVGLAVGGAAGTAPSGAPGAELLLLSSRLCSFPASVMPLDRAHVLPEPPEPVPMAIDDTEATLASTATQQVWESRTPGLQEGQSTEQAPEPPCCVAESGLELQSPTWDKASCSAVHPALPHLPIPPARRLHCTAVAEGALPKPPNSTDLGESLAAHPSTLQPAPCRTHTGPNLGPPSSSSESDWDVQLLCSLDALQGTRNRPVDLEVLRRTCINVQDSGYESHLYSVLKQKSELDLGRDDQSCRNCRAETEGAPFAVFEACLGSWTS
ncbi:Protein DBF4 like protein B [Chelonia mydas]|uniref:Protein DBF4 like protein B n=1 Tax=Chelonia mydas TaxID=8469 RepID=M7AS63_CHEMY|nr:Protein DBF4 like protein B [Chelonia mydas]